MTMYGEKEIDEQLLSFRIEENVLIGTEEAHLGRTNIGELILDRLKSKPDFVGQVEVASGKESTFAEMRDRSIKCALWLRKQGIQPGDKIGIWTDNHLDTYVPIFASLYVAAVVCPWDHDASINSARYCLSLMSPKMVFVNAACAKNLVEAAKEENLEVKVVVIGNLPGFESLTDILENQVARSEINEFCCTEIKNPYDVAIICCSSGSTGMPKVTELSYVSLYNSITPIEEVRLNEHVTLWLCTIRWHCCLSMNIEVVIGFSKQIIIPDIDDAIEVCKIIQKYGVTWLQSDPSIPMKFLKYNLLQEYPLPTLKKLVVSGAPFTKAMQEAVAKIMPHCQVLQCYGLTDAGGLCVSQTKNSKPGSCGFVTRGTRIKFIDENTGEALGPNKKGELLIKSNFLMMGYYKNSKETEAIDSDGWLHTKDIGYYDEDGEIYFVSRISDFINYKGINLSPAEIEGVLELHPSVFKAVVVSVPHATDVEHPIAIVEKVLDKEVTEEELHNLIEKTLPWYCKLVGGIKFVKKLPRLTTGKIDRKKLKLLAHYSDISKGRIENNILIGQEMPICKEPINVAEIVLQVFNSQPNHIGQVDAFTGKSSTYRDMSERTVKCALWLKKQGVKPGDIIGLCTDNNLNAIIPLLATLSLGAICNTWDCQLSTISARYFLLLTSPMIVFTNASSAEVLTEVVKDLKKNTKIVVLDKLDGYESLEDILKGHDTREVAEFKCATIKCTDEVALIVLSSGTTGQSKGTEISHFALYNSLLAANINDIESHICMWTCTLRWIHGIIMALKTIMFYSTRIIIPDYDNDVEICEFIEKYRVTSFTTEPCMLIRFIKTGLLEKYRLPTLKLLTCSGSHFKKEYREKLIKALPHVSVVNVYGSTDATAVCCKTTANSKLESVGFAMPNVRIKIMNLENGNMLGANQTGEICLKLPKVMNGYYNNPEETARAIDSDGWLHSGDVGYYDDNGELFLVDRISSFIIFRSINVSPKEIESILESHPAVLYTAVIGIPDEVDGQHPLAIIVPVPSETVTKEELIDLVESNLPDHCRLRGGVEFLNKFPFTATGKVARKELLNMFAQYLHK